MEGGIEVYNGPSKLFHVTGNFLDFIFLYTFQ